jgi:hypothetical protein
MREDWSDELAPSTEEQHALAEILGPRPWYSLTPDTETEVNAAQALRVSYYEVHGISLKSAIRRYRAGTLTRDALDTVCEAGFILSAAQLAPSEIALIERYTSERSGLRRAQKLTVRTPEAFITEVFYPWAYQRQALVIGHNLFFDLTRFATEWGPGAKRFRGGFYLKLCSCKHRTCWRHPPLQYKSLGRFKGLYQFRSVTLPTTAVGKRAIKRYKGRFVDTATLGRALLGPGDMSLKGLGLRAMAKILKWDSPDFEGPITYHFLGYLVNDVQSTYSLFVALRDLYRRHHLHRPIWSIYSEASLGKGYFQTLGMPRATERTWSVSPVVQGYAMSAYYGGRAEAHIRLKPVQVIYCDFKSQYATVNALMRLQDVLLAKEVSTRHVTAEVRELLESPNLMERLQDPATWPGLGRFVKLLPQDNILPVRADYAGNGVSNIGLNHLTSDIPLWYTLADVISSVLLTSKVPTILEAIELAPSAEQVGTRKIVLFGDERYTIDLTTTDFFTAVIDLRTEVKAQMKQAAREGNEVERAHLDGIQTALKLLASSTAYGVLVEVNEKEYSGQALPIDVYALETHRRYGNLIEEPGPYFAGAIGPLIPAGGRLLLAIAERLAKDCGLTYALCDTDQMSFARPEGMAAEDFANKVRIICEWFTPLSPYRRTTPIFEYEDVNFPKSVGEARATAENDAPSAEALYALTVSPKRYVLYNKLPNGEVRIRKFSSHGLGLWGRRSGYTRPSYIPPPCEDVQAMGGPDWVYDLWYEFVFTMESGHYPDGRPLQYEKDGVPRYVAPDSEWLNAPAFYQMTIATWAQWRQFQHLPGLRPGNFITILPPPDFWDSLLDETDDTLTDGDDAETDEGGIQIDPHAPLKGTALYTGYCKTVEDVERAAREGRIRQVKDNKPMPPSVRLTSMADVLRTYFQHPEWKAERPTGVGEMARRHVVATGVRVGGKESNRLAQMMAEETNSTVGAREALGGHDYGETGVRERLSSLLSHTEVDLMAATCLPRSTIRDFTHGSREPKPGTLQALSHGLAFLDPDNQDSIAGWRERLTQESLIAVLGVDARTASDLYRGKSRWSIGDRARLTTRLRLDREAPSLK